MKTLRLFITLVAGTLAGASAAQAQALDPTFSAPSVYGPGTVYSTTEQADGKLVAVGNFTRVNGTLASRLVRFNTNGTLDAAFNQQVGNSAVVFRARLLSNGQYLLVGLSNATPIQAGGLVRPGSLLRLNADGSGDASFDPGSGPSIAGNGYANIDDVLPLANGQALAVGYFDRFNGLAANNLVRLNANGAVDATFQTGTGANNEVLTAVAVANGKVLIGGFFTAYNGFACNGIARLNADGSFDPSFSSPFESFSDVLNLIVQPDGRILVAGYLVKTTAPGSPTSLVRLTSNGALDNSFFPAATLTDANFGSYYGEALAVQPDGKILVISTGSRPVVRLNPNGTPDLSYSAANDFNYAANSLTLLRNGQLIEAGMFTNFGGALDKNLVRLNTDGTLDGAFLPTIQQPGTIDVLVRQADGKLVAGGSFSEINGQAARRLARFNADGSPDVSFGNSTGNTLDLPVSDLALQPNGAVLAAAGPAVYRYLPSGSPDNSFSARSFSAAVTRLALQPDGRILAGGSFSGYAGNPATGVVRLTSAGSYDPTFTLAPATGVNGLASFYNLALQPDGKLLVAGNFRAASGSGTIRLVRYTAAGSTDPTFSSANFTLPSGAVSGSRLNALALQPDGKVLVGGSFGGFGGVKVNNLIRLNANGSLDSDFTPPALTSTVNSLAVQPNNHILVGGSFTFPTVPANLARLLPDGTSDASFGSTAVPNGSVRTILPQPDGSLVIGGSFTSVGGQPRMALARLVAPNVLHVKAPAAIDGQTTAWPVPAHTQLHVALAPTAHAQQLELLDALGRPVRQQQLAGRQASSLALEGLPAGIYLLRVTYAEGIVSRRVQLQ